MQLRQQQAANGRLFFMRGVGMMEVLTSFLLKGEVYMISKKCWCCGKPITPRAFVTHQLFCSDSCRREYKAKGMTQQFFDPIEFDCSQCGRRIRVETPDDKRTRFCSASCEKKYWRHPPYEQETARTNFHSVQEYLSWERRTNA